MCLLVTLEELILFFEGEFPVLEVSELIAQARRHISKFDNPIFELVPLVFELAAEVLLHRLEA